MAKSTRNKIKKFSYFWYTCAAITNWSAAILCLNIPDAISMGKSEIGLLQNGAAIFEVSVRCDLAKL